MDEKRFIRSLELDRILDRLADVTENSDAAVLARAIMPSGNRYEVERRLQNTSDAYNLIAKFGSPDFGMPENVDSILERAKTGAALSMGELLGTADLLKTFRSIDNWRKNAAVKCSLDDLFDGIIPNKYLEEKIFGAIVSPEEMSDNASTELRDIRRKIRSASSIVREKLDKIIHSASYAKYLQEPVVTIRDDRFVVPVKAECRSMVAGLVHDTSSSGSTVFIEPMSVVEANNDIRVLRSRESAEIERILYELSEEVGGFSEGISRSKECAVELCVIFAKAKLGFDMKASVPIINDAGRIDLKRARHPLLDKDKVVPISVSLGKDYDTLVITGPNTGGKTVTLKTIGLLTLMAECGMMIPAMDSSEISVFDRVMSDIGDEQSIEQNLSTFSSHMVNIIRILKSADGRSLVLLDELGAGTDPVEGAALATTIINQMRSVGAKSAVTTHYAELKAFALDTEGIENASCEFDVETLKPTYRLMIGVPGRSNAFAISERLGLPKEIVDKARELVSDEDNRFERVVSALERARTEAEREKEEVQRIKDRLSSERTAAETRLNELEVKRDEIIEKARADATRIIGRASATANALLGEIDELKKQAHKQNSSIDDIARQARAAVKSGQKKFDDISAEPDEQIEYQLPRPLEVGDRVFFVDVKKDGVVTALKDKSGKLTVQMGNVSLKVDEGRLRLSDKQTKKSPSRSTRRVTSRAERKVETSIDLRGKTADEAILELDRFIDSSVMSGITHITVIHGKGTGVLKKAVSDYLKGRRSVRTYRLGLYGEGEDGVTIIELE